MRRYAGIVITAVAIVLALWWCRGDTSLEPDVDDGSGEQTPATSGTETRAVWKVATLSGRVTSTRDGTPIEGATVAISPSSSAEFSMRPSARARLFAQTDRDGRWRVAAAQGGYTVGVAARGVLPAQRKLELRTSDVAGIDLALEPGGTELHGIVTDVGGGPIANVRIDATLRHGMTTFETVATVSDATGHYALSLHPGWHTVGASHDDYASDSESVQLPASGRIEQNFALAPGAVLRGRVVSDAGDGVPEALVEVRDGPKAITDADGRFEVRAVPSGIRELRAIARKFRSVNWTELPVSVGEQRDDVRLVVIPALVIQGRTVVKGDPSKPVPEALVNARGLGIQTGRASVRSDLEGNFELRGLGAGPYSIGVWNGDVSVMMEYGLSAPVVELVDRDVTGVTLELDVGITVVGTVEPAMTTSVKAACKVERVQSDPTTGRFVIDHLPPGGCEIVATSDDGWSGRATATPGRPVAITLQRHPTISGRVVRADGSAARSATLEIAEKNRKDRLGRDDVVVQADGTFRTVRTSHEAATLRVTAYERGDNDGVSTEVEFSGLDIRDLTITVPSLSGRLRGIVVDGSGKPVADARVSARREYPDTEQSAEISTAFTSGDGRFVLERLRADRYQVTAWSSNGALRGQVTNVDLEENPRITLSPLGSIKGRVTVDGAPAARFEVSCSGSWQAGKRDGSFEIPYLAPRTYSCRASADEGTAEATVEVSTGAATLELAIALWGTVTGTFVDLVTGEPVPNLFVFTSSRSVEAGKVSPTDAAGRFRFESATGPQTLMNMSRDGRFQELAMDENVIVRPGAVTELGVVEGIPARASGDLGIHFAYEGDTAIVQSVDPALPAASTGIRAGDIVTGINGRPVARLRARWWNAFGAGITYRITLARGITVSVTAKAN